MDSFGKRANICKFIGEKYSFFVDKERIVKKITVDNVHGKTYTEYVGI